MIAEVEKNASLTGFLSSINVIATTTQPDSGYIALVVIGSLLGSSLALGALLYLGYRQCSRRSINSMNFENPVYRKTTEDHFSLEKNLPVRMYPSTVDEEVSATLFLFNICKF
uniref:Uncharacterized protein n=1 Tax=Glossina brevipalpis TaxID=37001 RepID=A0A1A9WTR3_9MUSC